jgi:hypothetical protein
MEIKHHLFCGGIPPQNIGANATKLVLNLWKNRPEANVHLTIEHLHQKFFKNIPAQFHDLLEIAAYVNSGDQALKRGARDVESMGANWRRRMHFHIPVRRLSLWNEARVKGVLQETLDYLSDDFYEFTFYPATDAPLWQDFFPGFDTGAMPRQKPEQVMMSSGGLDSLAGAIEEIIVKKKMVALVNHQSTIKFKRLYEALGKGLMEKCGDMKPQHLRVEINKSRKLSKEYTQRSRSFLYASLGATVAMMLDLRKLSFYENGIVSLNLPVCAQVIGGRATRTTHPRVLAGFQQLFSLLANEPFTVDNPFLWNTKGEVVKKIVAAGCGPLIESTRSCAHTWETTNQHTHCGVCSQCIDRRFGMIAGLAEDFDPLRQYKLDIFTQSPPKDADKIMGAAYLEKAIQCETLKDIPQFIADNPEVRRVLRHIEGTPTGAAGRIMDLHQRHAKEVTGALKTMLGRNLDGVIKATLPPDCLLRISYETGSPMTMPAVEQDTIVNLLPVSAEAVATPAPENVIRTIGRFRYVDGLVDIWLGDEHYDLRERTKARLCIKYLVEKQAFDAASARHFVDEIDVYVREIRNYLPAADIKIDHYFNDQSGRLPKLRKDLITVSGGRDGKFYLKTD